MPPKDTDLCETEQMGHGLELFPKRRGYIDQILNETASNSDSLMPRSNKYAQRIYNIQSRTGYFNHLAL